MSERTLFLGLVVTLGLIFLSPVSADVVHLMNGNALEGVVLEETSETVRIRLPFGELGLPRSSVRAIERLEIALGEFLERWQRLETSRAPAEDWLKLARWARAEGLRHGAKDALLVAARLDPRLDGLAPLMHEMDYVFDEPSGRWIAYDDFMYQRGFVLADGRWLPRSEVEARARARLEELDARRSRAGEQRLMRAMELMVMTQIAQAEESRRLREQALVYPYGLAVGAGLPVAVVGGVWPGRTVPVPDRSPPPARAEAQRLRQAHRRAVLRRPPGSLIPVELYGTHRGRFSAAPIAH